MKSENNTLTNFWFDKISILTAPLQAALTHVTCVAKVSDRAKFLIKNIISF